MAAAGRADSGRRSSVVGVPQYERNRDASCSIPGLGHENNCRSAGDPLRARRSPDKRSRSLLSSAEFVDCPAGSGSKGCSPPPVAEQRQLRAGPTMKVRHVGASHQIRPDAPPTNRTSPPHAARTRPRPAAHPFRRNRPDFRYSAACARRFAGLQRALQAPRGKCSAATSRVRRPSVPLPLHSCDDGSMAESRDATIERVMYLERRLLHPSARTRTTSWAHSSMRGSVRSGRLVGVWNRDSVITMLTQEINSYRAHSGRGDAGLGPC